MKNLFILLFAFFTLVSFTSIEHNRNYFKKTVQENTSETVFELQAKGKNYSFFNNNVAVSMATGETVNIVFDKATTNKRFDGSAAKNDNEYQSLDYKGIAANTDISFYTKNDGSLAYSIGLNAGVNSVKFTIEKADKIYVDASGNLVCQIGNEEIVMRKPIACFTTRTPAGKAQKPLDVSFNVSSNNVVSIAITEDYETNSVVRIKGAL